MESSAQHGYVTGRTYQQYLIQGGGLIQVRMLDSNYLISRQGLQELDQL
jgi:hypothetical protein